MAHRFRRTAFAVGIASAASANLCHGMPNVGAASVDALTQQFLDSDFIFSRARSDVPFVPLAWIDVSAFQNSALRTTSSDIPDRSFRQTSLSEATLLPLLLSRRDAILVGQWGSWTRLHSSDSKRDTEVASLAAPLGWARQASPDWQLAVFVAPTANLSGGHWYWDYLGGVFGRYLGQRDLVWIFGFYAEITPPEALYVPYVGVTWTIDQHWTLSAVLPWPAVLYSPTPHWLLRLGLAPSTASWIADVPSANETPRRLRADLTSWDFGLRVERRAWKSVWVGGEAGVSAFRGFSFSGGEWRAPDASIGTSPYAVFTVTFRPALADSQ